MNHIARLKRILFIPGETISQRVVHGSIWALSLRISVRVFEFARIVILARLLSPNDFGLFGIATLVLSFFDRISVTGFDAALIRQKEDTESYLSPAWSALLIRGFALAVILLVVAPFTATFFKEPRAVMIVRALAVVVFLRGLQNIGVVFFSKELDFGKLFVYEVSSILATFTVTIVVALIYHSVWALVLGFMVGEFTKTTISYLIHPYRPHFEVDLGKTKELFNFGGWVWASSIVVFIAIHGDDVLLGKLLGVTALGYYQMAYRLSNLVSTEITTLFSQVLFPAYSKIQDDTIALSNAFNKCFRLIVFLIIPTAFTIFVFIPEFTSLVLGDKWLPIVLPVRVLVFAGTLRAISSIWGPLYLATGTPYHSFIKNLLRVIFTFAPIFLLTERYGVFGTSLAVLLGIIATVGYDLYYVQFRCNLNIKITEILMNFLVPMLSSIIFALFALAIKVTTDVNMALFTAVILACSALYLAGTYLLQFQFRYSVLQDLRNLYTNSKKE